jgi:hypothetical protein
MGVPLSCKKVTCPLGGAKPGGAVVGPTLALSVTGWPYIALIGLAASVILVASAFTVCVIASSALGAEPVYRAVI